MLAATASSGSPLHHHSPASSELSKRNSAMPSSSRRSRVTATPMSAPIAFSPPSSPYRGPPDVAIVPRCSPAACTARRRSPTRRAGCLVMFTTPEAKRSVPTLSLRRMGLHPRAGARGPTRGSSRAQIDACLGIGYHHLAPFEPQAGMLRLRAEEACLVSQAASTVSPGRHRLARRSAVNVWIFAGLVWPAPGELVRYL
jgi:hypothetical protein